MAGPFSPEARSKSLQNDFGPIPTGTRVVNWIAHIYDADPGFGGVELTDADCPGYEAPEFANADFEVSDEGVEVVLVLADATGPWTKEGRYVLLEDADNLGEFWDYVPINTVRATEAGPFDQPLQIIVFYADDSTEPS